MIKDPTADQQEHLTLSVYLKNGKTYHNRDTSSTPFGGNELVVVFWDKGNLIVVPMSEVKQIKMNFTPKKKQQIEK